MEELGFNDDNPGSVRYGNFINYYQFHPADDRIKLLPTDIWQAADSFFALDIGCNAGDLTLGLYKYLMENVCVNSKLVGIDIDPVLIERANERNQSNNVLFKHIDFMNCSQRKALSSYLENMNIPQFDAEICNLSKTIVIEPQPWKCYRTAVKRLKLGNKEFSSFKYLKLRDPVNDIERLIIEKGFHKVKELYETKWKRKILVFNKVFY